MTDRVRVLIATTQGPVEIEAIIDLDPGEASIVALGSSADVVPGLLASYRNFVAKGSGVVARSFGHEAFRLELSGEIHAGESWQLAVFIAHALHRQGRLAEAGEAASSLVWATGQVDYHLRVAEIGHVPEKVAGSLERLGTERAAGTEVHAVWPRANASDADETIRARLAALGIRVHEAEQAGAILAALGIGLIEAAGPEAAQWSGSPYRGLAAFGQAERSIFFGRGRAREEALSRLRTAAARDVAFLLIHGSSGAGKSSLARAALIGDIAAEAQEADVWHEAVLPAVQPGRSPLRALAQALAAGVPGFWEDQEDDLLVLMATAPQDVVARLGERLGPAGGRRQAKLVLLIDQLEDVLFWAREPEGTAGDERARDRDRFAALVERLARCGSVWVVATLRSDLLSRLEDSKPLSRLAADARLYRLERPSRAALREIVLGPARLAGLSFEGEDSGGTPLVDVLVDTAARSPDSLPLLQFGLDRLFELRDRKTGTITAAAYERIDGLEGAIGRHAEACTAASFGEDGAMIRAVEDVVLGLARPDQDGGTPLARTLLLDPAFETGPRQRAIAAMVEARLVTLDQAPAGGRSLRVAHEALLTHWPRAQQLLDSRRAALDLRERLEGEARAWEAREQDPSYLIQAGRALSAAQDLVEEGRIDLSASARAFAARSVEAARTAADAELARLQQAARTERRRLRVAVAVAAVLVVLAGGTGWFWRQASLANQLAERNLGFAMETANTLTYDLARKFRNVTGMPVETVKSILDLALRLQRQLRDIGGTSASLERSHDAALDEMAQTLLRMGDAPGALAAASASKAIDLDLLRRDPGNDVLKLALSVSLQRIGDIRSQTGDGPGALAAYAESLVMLRDLARLRDDAERGLSISLDRIGTVKAAAGDDAGALAAFTESLTIRQELARRQGGIEAKRDIAVSLREIGDAALRSGEEAGALSAYQDLLAIAREIATDKTDARAQRDLSVGLDRVGDMKARAGDAAGALAHYDKSLALRRALAEDKANAEAQRDLATSFLKTGDMKARLGDRPAALAADRQSLAILRDLSGHDGTVGVRRDLGVALNTTGDLEAVAGDLDGARAAYEEALSIARDLAARTADTEAQRDLSVSLNKVGDIRAGRGDMAGAEALYDESLAIARRLAEADHDPRARRDLSVSLNKVGDMEARSGHGPQALALFEESLALRRGLAKGRDSVAAQQDLSVSLAKVGDTKASAGDRSGALAAYTEGLATARALAQRNGDPRSWRDVAVSLNRIGDVKAWAGDAEGALAAYGESLGHARRLVEQTGSTAAQRDLAYGLLKLADLTLKLGRTDASAADYRDLIATGRAISTAPDPEATDLSDLAWILATCPISELRDAKSALALASQAAAMTNGTNIAVLAALAAAYARSGDYDRASSLQQQVVESPLYASDPDSRQRLANYRTGKPWPAE